MIAVIEQSPDVYTMALSNTTPQRELLLHNQVTYLPEQLQSILR